MSFTGKATYSSGSQLAEIAEDVSDLISINSPHETPLLDALGDANRPARSTVHEWIEDTLQPNSDTVMSVTSPTTLVVQVITVYRKGDLIRFEGHTEIAMVTAINTVTNTLTVVRGFGGTDVATISAGAGIHIIGNASLEGEDASEARFLSRDRKQNYTQIFASTVSISGSELAVNQLAVRDEMAWQKNLRSRELLRDLENSVINGVADADLPTGDTFTRRTMRGILSFIESNNYSVGHDGLSSDTHLTEDQLNYVLRSIWRSSSGNIDLILVGGKEKRAINQFITSGRRYYNHNETFKDMVSVYESDFGVARVVLSRYVPTGTVILLDSSRLNVLPLAGRSFHYTPLARTGDSENGQMLGEYTLELRNERAHGVIRGFTT